MADVLTISGSSGHTTTLTISGGHAHSLAQAYTSAVNTSSASAQGETIPAAATASITGAVGTTPLFIGAAGVETVSSGIGADESGPAVLTAGSGNETLIGAVSSTGFHAILTTSDVNKIVSIAGGTGADTLAAGSLAQTSHSGSGASSMFTVSDFGSASSKLVALYGHGASEVSSAATTATVSGVNTTITLGDSTKVTFTDVSSLKSTHIIG